MKRVGSFITLLDSLSSVPSSLHLEPTHQQHGSPVLCARLSAPFLSIPYLADYLPTYVVAVTNNRKAAALGLLAVYLVLVILWAPLWLLYYLVTEEGVYAAIVVLLFKIG